MTTRAAHFVRAIIASAKLVSFIALLPLDSLAIQLRWSSGATDLTVDQATRATLIVIADSTESALPNEWRLLWTADSSGIRFVAPESLLACETDTAKVTAIDPPGSPADSAANLITAHFCSEGVANAPIAYWTVDLVEGSHGKLKVVALSPADTTQVIESNEATFNGGVDEDYAPVFLNATSEHSTDALLVNIVGAGLDSVTALSVGSEDHLWNVPLTITAQRSTMLTARAEVAATLPVAMVRGAAADGARCEVTLMIESSSAFPNLTETNRVSYAPQLIDAMTTGRSGFLWIVAHQPAGTGVLQGLRPEGASYSTFTPSGLNAVGVAALADSDIAVLGAPNGQGVSACRTYHVLPSSQTQLNSFLVADDPAGSSSPVAIAFGPDSLLYVLCQTAHVTVYSPVSGQRLRTLDAGNASAIGNLASSIAIDRNGSISVSVDQDLGSSHAYRIHRMDPNGSLINEILVPNFASRIACDLSGELFCLFPEPAYAQDALRVYSPTGSLELTQVLASPHALDFTGIATDPTCVVHIAVDSASTFTRRRLLSDADGDGLCDSWEVQGLQPGANQANRVPPGATPTHKDLYIQINAMAGFSPNPAAIEDVAQALALAPSDSLIPPNPNGQPGIELHYMFGDTTLTRMLLRIPFWGSFDSLKTLSFVSNDERSQHGADFFGTKDRVYRLCLFADSLLDAQGDAKAGKGKSLQCRDFIVALGPAEYYRDLITRGGTRNEQASVFMHELGHAIGLRHGGGDDNRYKPNYRSVMSYIWEMPNARVEPKWRLTYSNRPFNRLVKTDVNEAVGIGGVAGDSVFITVVIPVPSGTESQRVVPEAGAADLNGVNGVEAHAWCPDLDAPAHQQGTTTPILEPFGDWPLVRLSPIKNNIDLSDITNGEIHELSFAEHALLFPADGNPACDCNHNGRSDWRDIYSGVSRDANGNGVPDECEHQRVTVDRTVVTACPRGDQEGLLITADIVDLCAYDTAAVTMPKIAIARRPAGSQLIIWGDNGAKRDTLGANIFSADYFQFGFSRFSGHGTVYFDVFAGPLFLGRTPDIEVTSIDMDSLVIGAVDQFDVAAVAAHLGQTGPAWLDFDHNGIISPEDSTIVADHVADGVGRPLTDPSGGQTYALGDTMSITWVPGEGDSARVEIWLLRDGLPGVENLIARALPDDGQALWAVAAADAARSDYRLQVVHSAGMRVPDDANVYDVEYSSGPFAIVGQTSGVDDGPPLRFAVYPSWPNPARGEAIIRFDLPIAAPVRLVVYDIQGRVVRHWSRAYEAGRQAWHWDLANETGTRVAAGVYLYRLTAGPFVGRRKLVVIH